MTYGDSFSRCGCPVTAATGVLHGLLCNYGGARARAYTSAAYMQLAAAVVADPFGLTRRETQVAKLMIEGASNKDIARVLVVTESTVKGHMVAIMKKTDSVSRTQVARRLGPSFGMAS